MMLCNVSRILKLACAAMAITVFCCIANTALPSSAIGAEAASGTANLTDQDQRSEMLKELTLDECLSMAMENNHRRPASKFAVAVAEAQHRQALAGY